MYWEIRRKNGSLYKDYDRREKAVEELKLTRKKYPGETWDFYEVREVTQVSVKVDI